MIISLLKLKQRLPITPGVYLMKSKTGEILYIGKAANLKRRVLSYFERIHDTRITDLVRHIACVDIRKTATALEALILESALIKRFAPPYNIREKDNKSFLYVVITREEFPRVLLVRGKDLLVYERPIAQFGPFTSASSLRAALKILRRIFPWSIHYGKSYDDNKKPCFDYQLGLCPGTCIGKISRVNYRAVIRQLITFFKGGRRSIIRDLRRLMGKAARELRFEDAAIFRRRIDALRHIEDVALIAHDRIHGAPLAIGRIEGYDISHISGTSAVGSMVVFTNGVPNKNEYRKFRIKTVVGSNDVAMLREVIVRRFSHDWLKPDYLLIDGGLPQVNAVRSAIRDLHFYIPVIGIAKGPERKRNDFILPSKLGEFVHKHREILIRVRDEAHRFAVAYHRKLRARF